MSIELTMPRLSDTMESGTILKWNVKEGDEVSAGDVVADVETDKATMEMQTFDDGTVAKILVEEGKTVDVGTVIALLAEEGEDASDAAQGASGKSKDKQKKAESDEDEDGETATATKEKDEKEEEKEADEETEEGGRARDEERRKDKKDKKPRETAEDGAEHEEPEGDLPAKARRESQQAATNDRVRVSPVARRLADEHKIDIRSLEGSGPSGRIIKRDVLQAIESGEETRASVAPAAREKKDEPRAVVPATPVQMHPQTGDEDSPEPLEEKTIELSNMRQTIAKRLVESKTTIPHYQVTYTFTMDPLLELRSTLNTQLKPQGVKLSVNDFLVRACALAMHRHHEFNASWNEDSIKVHGEVNVGIAISLPPERGGGLIVGTVRHADQLGLRTISSESKRLARKARTKGLSQEELTGSTFTLSNLGMYGVEHFTAIINPPNTAILAVGAAVKKPVVRKDELTIGHEMQATLSCDHRVIDGAMAAEYLQTLRQFIENPGTLLV